MGASLTDEEVGILEQLETQLEHEDAKACSFPQRHAENPPVADYKVEASGMWCTHLLNPFYACLDCVVWLKTPKNRSQWECTNCWSTWDKDRTIYTFTKI